ncbi:MULTISPECIES: GNAT family N-acetyltransferase [unclassified Nocardioides]|uniref:GNAT family N-acetyltransferase n=1 Tax=unclassified Nocardioides TaxID=2615069 RepID=UPI0006F564FC|nr:MULTISPECIES: GNAT family N-acetyltransferase [unclassified Nocardioides]KQY63884.1 GCN5 family acetyltransferase [Nocardioides sp. Root140]KQZ69802.1 GCN5 family acetyltransferase [Nocardioides sp. Root151]
MSSPTADVSVRVAWADDAPGIAGVQVRGWRTAYDGVLPADVLDAFTPDEVAAAWRESLGRPKDARNRVLVALERNRITGFAVVSPAGDPDCDPIADGEVAEFVVDPDELGKGHGSRLIQACADTLRADRFQRAVSWVNATDDAHRAFFESAGWAPDTAHRELDLHGDGSVTVKQVRLHTAL